MMPAIGHLGIVIPVYNDEDVLAELHGRLKRVVTELCESHEILFVDDGSSDRSLAVLQRLQETDPGTVIVPLVRNFGQPNPIAAGLEHVRGDVVIVMDSDLQDPPEDIPKLVAALEDSGCAMAIAQWTSRRDSSLARRFLRFCFRLTAPLTTIRHSPRLGVFRAIRRSAVDAVRDIPETTGSILGLMYWAGFSYVPVELRRDPRYAGKSGYTLKRLFALACDRWFSYAAFPVGPAMCLGLVLGLASIGLGGFFAFRKHFIDAVVPGWTSLIVIVLLLFGVNFIFLGLLGEYLGRIYRESKGRPRYGCGTVIRRE